MSQFRLVYFDCLILFMCLHTHVHTHILFLRCVCVLFYFINTILGNRYGPRVSSCQQICFVFESADLWVLMFVFYAATQLATQLRQRCTQVVRSNKETRKCLAESNGTSAMEFGCEEIRKHKYTQTKNRTKHTTTIHPQQ